MSLSTAPQLPHPALSPAPLLEPGWSQVRTSDEALRFLHRAADRDPREFPVGITLMSPLTGGRELACWFASWAQLWTALRYIAVHLSGKQGEDLKALACSLSQMRLSYGSDDLQVMRLQRMFGHQLRVLRLGTFQDLCVGVGGCSRGLVQAYRESQDENPASAPDGFIAFLRRRAFH